MGLPEKARKLTFWQAFVSVAPDFRQHMTPVMGGVPERR
jgi:hypothetical protein